MDGQELLSSNGATLIDGLTDDVDDAAEGLGTDGHLNGIASVTDRLTTHKTLGGVEGDGAHVVATQVLGDLEDETVLGTLNLERVEDRRKFALELHIDDGTNNLGNLSRGEAAYSKDERSVTSDRACSMKFYLRLLARPDSICNEIL